MEQRANSCYAPPMMTDQRTALLRLLSDDDPETLSLLKAQLAGGGLAKLPELQDLAGAAEGSAARHLREVIECIEAESSELRFGQICAEFGEDGNLEEAAWRLAALFAPGEDFARQRGMLSGWAREVKRRLTKAQSEVDRIETLVEYLGHEVKLCGCEEENETLDDALLPEVIETGRGLPITLSLIYLLVARRAGLAFVGVSLPGHFLVRCGEHVFDPFAGGRRIGLEECRALVHTCGAVLRPEYFQPATPRQILAGLLASLGALSQESDPELFAKVSGWLSALWSGGVKA